MVVPWNLALLCSSLHFMQLVAHLANLTGCCVCGFFSLVSLGHSLFSRLGWLLARLAATLQISFLVLSAKRELVSSVAARSRLQLPSLAVFF